MRSRPLSPSPAVEQPIQVEGEAPPTNQFDKHRPLRRLDSDGGPALLSALNGPRLVAELAKLLAFAFEHGVSEVYYESLADHPNKHGLMGLFDKWGAPKLSYGYLREVELPPRCSLQLRDFCSSEIIFDSRWRSWVFSGQARDSGRVHHRQQQVEGRKIQYALTFDSVPTNRF